jgi:glutamate/tyrosine decarboxylase-like PLP-dependent enzyme
MRRSFPESGIGWEELKHRMRDMRKQDIDWQAGRASLHVYYPGEDVLKVARDAYGMFISENGLAPAAFPSVAAMERDLIEAALDLFHASADGTGSLTSGGTESILLAMKAARDWNCEHRSKFNGPPEIVLPRTAHPAFDKAAHLLGLRAIRVPPAADHRANPEALAQASPTEQS